MCFNWIFLIFIFLSLYLFFFWISPDFLKYCEKSFNQKLIYFQISEPVVSLLKIAFVFTFLCFFPLLWYFVVNFVNFIFSLNRKHFWLFVILGWFLFYAGAVFAYKITLPYGIKFLISFKTKDLQPAISLGHFVNFFSFFVFILIYIRNPIARYQFRGRSGISKSAPCYGDFFWFFLFEQ